MPSVSKNTLLGNVGSAPDYRELDNGTAVASLSLATSEKWTDKKTGAKQERTEWHRVVFYGPLAKVVGEYVRSGMQLYVEGSNRTRKYTDSEGIERSITEVIGREMQMLGKRADTAGEPPADYTPPPSEEDYGFV